MHRFPVSQAGQVVTGLVLGVKRSFFSEINISYVGADLPLNEVGRHSLIEGRKLKLNVAVTV
jgi:hypothetical protein